MKQLPAIRRRSAPRPERWLGALGLGVFLLTGGCSGGGPVPVYPVSGQVSFEGEPTSGAFLVFHPIGGQAPAGPEPIQPTAVVRPDGSFQITTFTGGDGAPAGEYTATLEWRKTIYKGKVPEAGPNVIPPAYGKPDTTPLKVTVKPEPNALGPWKITR